jgi:uncharacterized protein
LDLSAIVEQIYERFEQRNVSDILDLLAEDVVWETGDHGYGVPWLEPRCGRQAVATFFDDLRVLQVNHFERVGLLTNDHQVGVLIEVDRTVRATGRTIRDSELHLWTFDDAGRVVRFRQMLDTHKNVIAYRADVVDEGVGRVRRE